MDTRFRGPGARAKREQLSEAIGLTIARFQDASTAFDNLAAEILAIERRDLCVMTMLVFGGPATRDELVMALHSRRSAITTTLQRLQLAGYVRMEPGSRARVELTEHAQSWVERIWAPLQHDGQRLLETHSTAELRVLASFLRKICESQEAACGQLRDSLASPASRARRSHLRGGLSPVALRRVQVFVEANLARPIQLHDLAARAALSPYHFARAFKTSAGMTPRAFVEQRRIERAKQLLASSAHSLASVAVDSGFGTQSRLTSTFKRKTGFTPGEYRRGRS